MAALLVDTYFVLALLKEKTLQPLKENDISEDMVFDDGRRMLDFVLDYTKKHTGRLPVLSTVLRRTGVKLKSRPKLDSADSYAKEIRSRYVGQVVVKEIQSVNKALREDPEKAAIRLQRAASHVKAAKLLRNDLIVNMADPKAVEVRKKRYAETKKFGRILGLDLPWPTLNDRSLGLHGGELCVLAGATGVGKTMALLKIIAHNWLKDVPTLLVSPEMPIDQMERRLDAMACNLAYERLRRGELGIGGEEKYEKFLDDLKNKTPLWIVDMRTVRTIDDVSALALDLDVKFVCIDGIYIMAQSSGSGRGDDKARWERTIDVVASAKTSAKLTNLPFVVTTQLSTSMKAHALTATVNDLGYAKGISQWADIVLAYFMNKKLRKNKKRIMRTLKARDFEPIDLLINFDMEHMNFDEVGIVEGGGATFGDDGIVTAMDDAPASTAEAPAEPRVEATQTEIPF